MSGALSGPDGAILRVRGLKKYFPIEKGFLRRRVGEVRAVDDVSFEMRRGEVLGLVGESGCGKTTTARTILRALDATAGEILFTRPDRTTVDLATVETRSLKAVRRDIQMIFQDPYSSLNPRRTVNQILAEPLLNYGFEKGAITDRIEQMLDLVGLNPKYKSRYPHAFSGGQRQRIGIARALVLNPSLVVADEPVSALDVSVQAQILNLLQDLQQELGLSYLFIAHDLSVVSHICDRVAVMYLGKIVELAESQDLFTRPLHPYTRVLIAALPEPDPRIPWLEETPTGEVGDPTKPLPGCPFAPRCKYAEPRCHESKPPLEAAGTGDRPHLVACFRSAELVERGIFQDLRT
jgi:peptide/nickel transport system ATP-binding protein